MTAKALPISFRGGIKPINFKIEAKRKIFKTSANRALKIIGLYTHIEAKTALEKNYISALTIDIYQNFCFIRNPSDHTLSQFFELKKDQKLESLDLDTFIESVMLEKFARSCRSIYSDQGNILVKHLYRYENLQETIVSIFNDLSLTENPQLPRAKSDLQTDRRPYKDFLNSNQKTIPNESLPKKSNRENTGSQESKETNSLQCRSQPPTSNDFLS